MRLAVISDIHGNAAAFEAVIQDLREMSPDGVVFLGDLVMRGPQPAECAGLLRDLKPLAAVRGNHDHYFSKYPRVSDWTPRNDKEQMNLRAFEYNKSRLSSEDQTWVGQWPTEHIFEFGGVQIELYHAAPGSLNKIVWPWASGEKLESMHQRESTRLVCFGHTHHPFIRNARERLIVNCGSVGLPFDGDTRACYSVIDAEGPNVGVQLRRVSYDADKAVRIARERAMPDVELFELAVRKAVFAYDFPQKEHAR